MLYPWERKRKRKRKRSMGERKEMEFGVEEGDSVRVWRGERGWSAECRGRACGMRKKRWVDERVRYGGEDRIGDKCMDE